MAKYQMKPVDAFQWTGPDCALPEWAVNKFQLRSTEKIRNSEYLRVPTQHGCIDVLRGDWILMGAMGEFSVCRDEIFKTTYEPTE